MAENYNYTPRTLGDIHRYYVGSPEAEALAKVRAQAKASKQDYKYIVTYSDLLVDELKEKIAKQLSDFLGAPVMVLDGGAVINEVH